MNRVDVVWKIGRVTVQQFVNAFVPMRVYGKERVPREGALVIAMNHFSWLDPPAFGAACPRVMYYLAKSEVHRVPGLGHLIRAFGTFSVRRGQSDREAVRMMRKIVSDGHALGLFVEGTRQKTGLPGKAMPGAAMVALQENVPVLPAAIHGSQHWRLGNWHPVSIVWGAPMHFDDLPTNARGYREASNQIESEIHRLWQFLVEMHKAGRPKPALVELP